MRQPDPPRPLKLDTCFGSQLAAESSKDAFVTQMRTAWYRVDLRIFSNNPSISEMMGKPDSLPEVRK
jgi:hypothetical protein